MYGIIDTDSGIILATTENITLANMLMEIPPDTFLVAKIEAVNGWDLVKEGKRPLYEHYYQRYPEKVIGIVDDHRRDLRPNAGELSNLYRMKLTAAFKVMDLLRYHRLKYLSSFEFHGMIYEEKARQARDLLETQEVDEQKHSYVTSYAKVSDLTPLAAARLIKLKHEMFHQEMALNEALRIKYFNIIKRSSDPDEINTAYRLFHKETLFNQPTDKDAV